MFKHSLKHLTHTGVNIVFAGNYYQHQINTGLVLSIYSTVAYTGFSQKPSSDPGSEGTRQPVQLYGSLISLLAMFAGSWNGKVGW